MERSGRTHRVSLLPLWALALGCLDIAGLKGGSYVMAESTDIVKVSAVTGGDAALPCDTRTLSTDLLLLVVWYKDNVPMYSFDSRVKGPGSHWVDDILDGRVRWHATSPSTLRIHDVIPTDRALYRCRVDFKVSPTSNQKVLLDVIELPERPKIFDEYNKEVVAVAGPYVEDTSLKLSCVVSGGRPMPRLRWWRNDKIINTLAPLNDNSRISVLELFISRLSRDYFEAVYTCTADNTALVPPTRVNVQLHLYLKPLSVEIIPREQPLVVDQRADLSCRAVGARPPAIITWWLGHVQVDTAVQRDSDDRNETTSVLRWTPRIEQYGKTLTCRASHAILEHASIETTIKLNIHYSPIVELQLGSSLNPNDIEEGDDVYFNCIVNSNPPPYKVVWEHDDQIMTHNQRAGVIAGSAHLALQRVSRQQAGKYTCTASNVEGDGESNPVDLDILYKPTCKETGILIVGAAINEPTKITCEVEAFPNPTNFVWTLNNSLGTTEIDSRDAKVSRGKSVLSFTPSTDTDYGTVACRASNLAGQQLEPCLFKLLPAVRPDRPYDCYTYNITETSTTLKCSAGYDGGLQNKFFVEAWESRKIVVNKTSASPDWKLEGMKPGKTYKLFIYAYNRRGRSEPGVLRVHTLSRLALLKETSTSNGGGYLNWILGVILGVTGTLVVMMLLAMLAKKRRHEPVQNADPPQAVKTYKGSDHSENHSPEQPDDMNPDLIPLGKELNYLRETERLPEPPPYQSVMSPLVGLSKSAHSLHYHELRSTAHTPSTIETQSIGMLSEDRRSLASGTLSRKREIVTTRTPLLANTRESCV